MKSKAGGYTASALRPEVCGKPPASLQLLAKTFQQRLVIAACQGINRFFKTSLGCKQVGMNEVPQARVRVCEEELLDLYPGLPVITHEQTVDGV